MKTWAPLNRVQRPFPTRAHLTMSSASVYVILGVLCLLVQVAGCFQLPASSSPSPASSSSPTAKISRPSEGDTDALERARRSITPIERVELHGPPVHHRRTLYVEVVVLADYSIYRHYDTQRGALKRVTEILSVANKVLGAIGVVLMPAEVEVWHSDQIRVTSRLETNVNNLQKHRQRLLQRYPNMPNDYTILLTRKKQQQRRGSCGAPFQGMCRKVQSVSVVQDEGKEAAVTGVALAHQVGHSLGMQHDNEGSDNACHCDASTCVMTPQFRNTSIPNLTWSDCSKRFLDSALETLALDCLKNMPTRLHPMPTCGNGVVDDGEQCDCGPEEFCDNPCCNAATCKLASNASCASGSCCDIQSCKPKPPGVVCRAAVTECDLSEFCSGHSEYCPNDVTKADGTSCHEGYCFNGECGSREGQCKRLWGQSASAASLDCYSKLNTRGNHAGNCGMRRGRFQRCRDETILCGTLHCIASASSTRLLPEHRNGSARAGSHQCHFISGSEDYPAHHWLTPNGAPCGPGKMCINQQCQDLPKMTGACRDGCSGRGVCNSLGRCHCDAGLSPPDCLLPGLGGSVDSNVMSDISDPWLLITSAWMAAVLVVSLLAVMCCSWGCCKGWYKRKGRNTISKVLPCCTACLDTCCCPVMTKSVHWVLTVGSSEEKKQMKKDIEVQEGADEHMLCSVDVDVKSSSHTNTWGVASQKLVTEYVNVTPKNSPDFRRKVTLKKDSPLLHHKSEDNLQRHKYQQSISVDSGCISDTNEDVSNKRASLELSMNSLLSVLMRFGDKKSQTTPDIETRREKKFGNQKSVPLSRFVVDPLAGRRSSSRQSSPSPHPIRPSFGRSFSTDVFTEGNRKEGTPPPPPATLKPNKSEENLSASEMPERGRILHRQESSTTDVEAVVSVSSAKHNEDDGVLHTEITTQFKLPLKTPKNKSLPSPPRVPPKKPNTPPQATNQQHQITRSHDKHIPLSGPSLSNPVKTSPGSQNSSPGTGVSNKIIEMARKFENV